MAEKTNEKKRFYKMSSIHFINEQKQQKTKVKVLPRLELGLLDSESRVLTITP